MKQKFHDVIIMEFIVGYNYKNKNQTLDEIRKEILPEFDELDNTEEQIVDRDPSHLIVMFENNQIIGWAIWHESNTREHQKGAPRNEEDIKILETLSNGQCEVIELHELWLKKAHRGKGYGKQFFDFFEDFITSKGYNKLVYYTDNASAISICRKRGYKESYYKDLNWHTFYKVVNAQ